jgi:hypothetical protein
VYIQPKSLVSIFTLYFIENIKKEDSRIMYTGEPRSSGSSTDDEANSAMDIIVTPAYQEWLNIRDRCYNPNNPSYKDFGAIGAKCCDEWRHSYSNFLRDMGTPPNPHRTFFIERIDSTESYYKANCRWTVRQESNRRLHFQINPSGNFDLLAPSTDPKTPTTKRPPGTFDYPSLQPKNSVAERKPTPRPQPDKCTIM